MKTARMIVKLGIVALIAGAGVRPAGATLLAKFSFDSMTGLTVADISGNGHTATFSGSPTLSTDNPFPGAPFVVPNKSVDVSVGETIGYPANPGTIDLNNHGMNQFTFEGWIKPTSHGYMTLVECDDNAASGYYSLGTLSDGTPTVGFYSGYPWFRATGPTPLTLNVWTHLAAVYNRGNDGVLRLYVNGVDVADENVAVPVNGPCDNVLFGGGGGLGQVKGLLDDIAIFNTALDPSQLGYYKSFSELVPEPSSLALLALGGLLVWRRRTK